MIKEEGGENDLLERIAGDPVFGVTLDQLHAVVRPENMWAVRRSRRKNSWPALWLKF